MHWHAGKQSLLQQFRFFGFFLVVLSNRIKRPRDKVFLSVCQMSKTEHVFI